MPRPLEIVVGKLALRHSLVSTEAIREALSQQQARPGSTLGQILVGRGHISQTDLQALHQQAQQVELRCLSCQRAYPLNTLDGRGGLACPACRRALSLHYQGSQLSDRFATGQTARMRVTKAASHASQHPTMFDEQAGGPPESRRFTPPQARGEFTGRFGPYEILRELGRGGMGVVYQARQPELERFVALKILLAGPMASPKQIKRFRREAEITARLKHPAIVQIHDVGQVGDYSYFTMDFIEGAALNELIKKRTLGLRRAVEIARDVAEGLDHAHGKGAIHRDIKPANILVDQDGRGVLTDFGLARDMDPDALSRLTRSGAAVGTPYYMSPEQARGERELIKGTTDVYSLGVVLFEALTFQLPFNAQTQLELTNKILHEDPPLPSSIEPAIHRDLETIVLKSMAKDPRDRFASAGDMAEDLDRYLRGEPIEARREAVWERVARQGRRHWPQLLVAGLVSMVVALGSYVVARELQTPPAPQGSPDGTSTTPQRSPPSPDDPSREAKERARKALAEAAGTGRRQDYRGLLEHALEELAVARQLDQEDLTLVLLEARALIRVDREAEAWERLRTVRSKAPPGPLHAEASFLLGRQLIRNSPVDEPTPEAYQVLEEGLAQSLTVSEAGVWRDLLKGILAMLRDEDADAGLAATERALAQSRDHPEIYSLIASGAAQRGQPDDAVSAMERALRLDDKDAYAWTDLAQLRLLRGKQGDTQRALEEELPRALELNPDLVPALILRARLFQARGESELALADLKRVAEARPEDVELLLSLAQLHAKVDDASETQRLLARAENLAPQRPEPYLLQAGILSLREDFRSALDELTRGLKATHGAPLSARLTLLRVIRNIVHAPEWFERLLKIADELQGANADDPLAPLLRAECYLLRQESEQAFAALRDALAKHPRDLPTRQLEIQAVAAFRPAELPELVARFSEDFADDPAGLGLLARFHSTLLDDAELAEATARRALRLDPRQQNALTMLGFNSYRNQAHAEARAYLLAALSAEPFHAETLAILGGCEMELGNAAQAERAFQGALQLEPFRADAVEGLATLYIRRGDPTRAVSLCRDHLRLYEKLNAVAPVQLALTMAHALAERESYQAALNVLEGIRLTPGVMELSGTVFQLRMADVYAKAGRLDLAREVVNQVLKREPDHGPAQRLKERLGGD